MERPLIFICSPYSGDVERNQDLARSYCRFALKLGGIPLAPHLLFPQFMDDDDPDERSLALSMNKEILAKCDELWIFGSKVTSGMLLEATEAIKREIPIRRFRRTEAFTCTKQE
ncbi:MAG: DUF4406 domain-containing protein [Eubacterium sp.]|jgi:hypothetical protein|nr:DUF4406 domain-containing protein [Eubacterium sp.]MCH4078842.1 DUF4406 domain-containing protein [Eubacterium sp.]